MIRMRVIANPVAHFTPPRTEAEAKEFVRRAKERQRREDAAKTAEWRDLHRQIAKMAEDVRQGEARARARTSLDPREIYAARAGRKNKQQKVEKPSSAPRRRPRSFNELAREIYGRPASAGGALIPTGLRGDS